ncbi:MAG: PadR family transcriptional regulator [Candidatus Bathycorpusculaceae bacterium]
MVKIGEMLLHGLEKPIIIWLLYRKPSHGYELITEFKKLTGRKLKSSVVYPFLHQLEMEGFASSQWMVKGRRKVRHYSLTKRGEELLRKVREIFAKPVKEFFIEIIGEKKIP